MEDAAHGFDCGVVGGVLVTSAHPARRRDGGGLGRAHEFESEQQAFRLALCRATQSVIARALDLIGVDAPDRM